MRWLYLLLAVLPFPATAATRTFSVGSFERVRIEGTFKVSIATGASPSAQVEGPQDIVDRVEIRGSGGTITVRLGGSGWGERPASIPDTPVVVRLATPALAGITVIAGAEVNTGPLRGDRIDLATTGPGTIRATAVAGARVSVTVIGNGTIAVASGSAADVRLSVNGPGTIAAPTLIADALVTRVEGSGTIDSSARYTAQVTTTGLGAVTVHGRPKCTVRAVAGGPVACGKD